MRLRKRIDIVMSKVPNTLILTIRGIKILSIFIVSVYLLSCGSSVPAAKGVDNSIQNQVRQSTPEETVMSYYTAKDNNDIDAMRLLIDNTDESSRTFLQGFINGVNSGVVGESTNIRINVVEKTESFARIRTNYYGTLSRGNELIMDGETGSTLSLVRKGDKWYFIGLADPIPPGWILER